MACPVDKRSSWAHLFHTGVPVINQRRGKATRLFFANHILHALDCDIGSSAAF